MTPIGDRVPSGLPLVGELLPPNMRWAPPPMRLGLSCGIPVARYGLVPGLAYLAGLPLGGTFNYPVLAGLFVG